VSIFFEIIAGILIANLYEWIIHKYVLHGLGKRKGSRWSSHWTMHHRKSRRNENFDDDYLEVFSGDWNEGRKEIIGLLFLTLLQAPMLFVFPWYVMTMTLMAIAYFFVHRKSHLDIEWAKRWVPWHYDHHMGKNQECNWGITLPLWDYILGTRKIRRP
jgi:sterol desaturase/sphingolipid hydroxylase (fatty acid hydroxylase superfamily)